jgi:hypothetical protein
MPAIVLRRNLSRPEALGHTLRVLDIELEIQGSENGPRYTVKLHHNLPMKFPVFLFLAVAGVAQTPYDLLLKGGHVIDAKNHINEVRDVAIQNGRVAEVASNIDRTKAAKVVDVSGLYVTPGLVDIHVHVYAGTGKRGGIAATTASIPTDSRSAWA